MIPELIVTVSIATMSGLGVLGTQLHRRITVLDNRLDSIELRIAEQYVTRSEMCSALDRIDAHILRIENKLDNLTHLPCYKQT